ncbi:trafficking protein particle complex subunit 8 [Aplysia californica]|uniref:Trafficking protein particle complex subunit 8 n=1 Tax=Aplysia californica TaxID=6500 RepID=A0ABM0K046_APLCA|nr:trafficking protein particle complex subunit 8 [Aplysia californica]
MITMSQCKQSASEFIQNTFSPHIAVLCSNDAQLLCEKNNLSFVQLIQPFCRLSSEVHIRDANNVTHSIHNLRISACDMGTQLPQQGVIKKQLSDAVASTQGQSQEPGANNMMSIGNYDLQLSPATPWFESWREAFLQVLPPSDHEYLNHCLACIFVVASNNSDPLSTFTALANQQVTQQQQFPNRLPRWFCQGVLHYYVLLHDVLDGEQTRAEALYQSMKATFGVQICHLLQINSRSVNTMESLKTGLSMQPDPWSQFLNKPSPSLVSSESIDSDHVSMEGSPSFPSQLSESNHEQSPSNPLTDSFYENNIEESGSSGITTSSSCDQFSHPLASPTTPPSRDTPSPDSDPTAAAGGYQGESRSFSVGHHRSHDKNVSKSHGMCLTPSDLDRLRIFMHEFVVRALIPWAERQMKMLSEQLTSRKGIHRSIFSATKKWFGNKPSGAIPASQNTTVVYTKDAPELQLRRLADLAFLFQMYEFSYNTYHTAKKDFNNDQAWLHFAGALEMASLGVFLQGPHNQKQYPRHYMETAISTYLTSCRNTQYATRATLTSTEALKKIGMYSEAALQFLKMTSEDSDLTSALFLEQAAHCFLALKTPMVRKYSFHMILAGHRFSKAGQRKHSLRSYSQALQIYKAKHWSIAEDHIHFTIGRQSVNLKQLENATAAFKHLLTEQSKQPTSQQAAFLREYLFVYKQLLSQEERDSSSYGHLPELPLPLVNSNATKVLLSGTREKQEGNGRKTSATGMWFSDEEHSAKWDVLEERMTQISGRSHKPNPQLFTNDTDNRSSPVAFVGEPITIELQVENPLHVMLVLSEVSLLWTFIPSIQGPDPPQVISNEMTTGVKNSLADEIIQTSVIKEVIVQGIQNESIHLTLTPRQPGQLRVVGLAYNLGTSSLAQNSSLQQEVGSSSMSAPSKPSYTTSVLVRGKQRLEPQGPRLNNSKEERTQQLYGPDRRLDLLIHEEMPSLDVVFCDFPENLLCGEVQCIEIEFTNSGKSPLQNLRVTSSHPRFFTFGRNSELPKYPYVYQMRAPQCSSLSSTLTSTIPDRSSFLSLPDVLDIPLPKGALQPGDTLSLPLWLRGDDIGGVHEVDFLFYYEPVKHSCNIRHRVVRHCTLLNTVESLSVRTTVSRPSARAGATRGQELNSCIFACELENLSQVQIQRPHVQELQVTQVSCVSPWWTLVSLGAKHHSGVRLGSRETLQLVMKGLKQEQENESEKLVFSEVAFDRDQVNSACSPCSDFFVRSSLRHKQLSAGEAPQDKPPVSSPADSDSSAKARARESVNDLESAVMLNLTLVFLWKAYVVQESGQMKIVVGQHHVHVDQLNACATSYPTPPTAPSRPPLRFTRVVEQEQQQPPSPEVTTHLVTYSFTHVHQKEHAFSRGMCVVPVTLVLQNHSEREVHVVVDTSKTPESLSSGGGGGGAMVSDSSSFPQQLPSSASSSHSVRWVGLTQATLTLSKGQNSAVSLKAGVTRPGTYNLNNISVFVTYSSDQSQMILQKHATPSIITLVDTS